MTRRWLLGLGGAALVVAGLAWALPAKDGALELSERTDVIAMVCAVVGVVGMAATFWRPPGTDEDLAAAVARLAQEVRAVGEPQWMRSLGGDLTPIDVTFTYWPYADDRAAVLPAAPARQLVKVVEDYREIKPGRLVITGEPGAGKTVLARKFVMEFNRVRTEQEPVPVLIALADWDEDEPLADWITRHVERDYGLPRTSARQVVRARMVLPVLDGLDEMDAADNSADRRRAKTALQALDRYQDGTDAAPLVLTCRTAEYDAFEVDGLRVLDSARIEIDAVTPAQAHRFLSRRGAVARRPGRWQRLLDNLLAEPVGVPARALSTPWRLALAATVYEQDGDPAELLGAASEGEVADLLLRRYIRGAVRASPRTPGRYRPDDVHRWLAVLARSLGAGSAAETDLVLFELGRRIPDWKLQAVRWGLWGACVAGSAAALLLGSVVVELGPITYVAMAVLAVSLVLAMVRQSTPSSFGVPPFGDPLWRVGFRLAVRRPDLTDVRTLLILVGAPAYALIIPQADPQADFWTLSVLSVVVAATWSVLAAGAMIDTAACGPAGVLRGAAIPAIANGLAIVEMSLALLPVPLAVATVCWGLAVVEVPSAGAVHYFAFVLWNARRLPLRLAGFLDWCVAAGLVRTTGVAYQFRHREFQEWLVRHPEPVREV